MANYGSTTVQAYTINQSTGALTSVGTTATGTNPFGVAVDPTGRFAYVTNYNSTTVQAYTINNFSAGSGYFAGNLGIGTSAPIANLDVVGTASVSGNLTLGYSSALQSAYGPLTLNYKSGADAYTAGLTLTNSGYVGIGTTDPLAKLDVRGNIFLPNAGVIAFDSSLTGPSIYESGNGITLAGTGPRSAIVIDGNSNSTIYTYSDNAAGFKINQGSNTLFYTKYTGEVGIGTTTPTAKLDIAGDASTSGSLVFRGTSPAAIDILNGSRLDFQTSPGGDTGLAAKMTLLGNGNLGIGITNPISTLHVNGTSANSTGKAALIVDQNQLQDIFTASSSGATKFRITNNGFTFTERGNLSYDSYFGDEFNKSRGAIAASTYQCMGDYTAWSFTENSTSRTKQSPAGSEGLVWIKNDSTPSTGMLYTGDDLTSASNLLFNVGNLPSALIKMSTEISNTQVWVGLTDANTATTSDFSNGIFFTNNTPGGTSLVGKACSGGSCTATSSCGTYTAGNNAIFYIKVNSTSSVEFYTDNNISDGINLAYCGTVTSNIPTGTRLGGAIKQYVNASVDHYTYVDYFRVWQDDPVKTNVSENIPDPSISDYDSVTKADIAENYPTVDSTEIQPGTIVSAAGDDLPFVTISKSENDKKIIGIVSTSPNMTIGANTAEYEGNVGNARVALSGRVPVRIDPKSESISAGDYITSSGNDGMGKKITQAGVAVGKALEDWTPESGKDTILVFVNLTYFDPDIYLTSPDQIQIEPVASDSGTISYFVRNLQNEIITRIGAFSAIVVANIKAGLINTADVVATGTINTANFIAQNINTGAATVGNLIADSFTAFQGTVDNMLVKSGLVAGNINTKMISPLADSTDVTIQVGSATESGKLAIQNATGAEVASIDSSGNASFSGTINGQQLTIGGDATFSGTLVADNIKSKSLDEIQALLTQVRTDQDLLKQASDWSVLTATNSANLDQLALGDLYITNQAAINSLSVTNSLTLGTDIVFQSTIDNQNSIINSIDTLSSPLKIQSLAMAPIEMMAGLVKIDTFGNVQIAGNLAVAGQIESAGLTLKDNQQSIINNQSSTPSASLLSLQNTLGTNVATIDASGSARFNNVSTQGLTIAGAIDATASAVINGVIKTNATAGSGVVPAGVSEITIENASVTDYTLVYVTPTSSTDNYVLYVKSKGPGKFVVGFTNPISIDVNFNWWIVQTAQ